MIGPHGWVEDGRLSLPGVADDGLRGAGVGEERADVGCRCAVPLAERIAEELEAGGAQGRTLGVGVNLIPEVPGRGMAVAHVRDAGGGAETLDRGGTGGDEEVEGCVRVEGFEAVAESIDGEGVEREEPSPGGTGDGAEAAEAGDVPRKGIERGREGAMVVEEGDDSGDGAEGLGDGGDPVENELAAPKPDEPVVGKHDSGGGSGGGHVGERV